MEISRPKRMKNDGVFRPPFVAASWLLTTIIGLFIIASKQVEGAGQIDNGVVDLPQVSCEEDMVSLVFTTEQPFNGRIFVKGMSDTDGCMTEYPGNTGNSVVFQMGNGGCNMRRQRRLGPNRGVEQSMTVIISFHNTFITKIDRAYRCTCFFMEADKVVTSQFEVSMLATTDLVDTARMPVCNYSVRRGSVDGEVLTYARVGETAYHVWECDGEMFGMLVHSCFVDDGAGENRFQLLDTNGCAVDPVILTDLTYSERGNRAFVEAHVFKFADRVNTYFQCAMSLCMISDGACEGLTPPTCASSKGKAAAKKVFKRDAASSDEIDGEKDRDLDVSADKIVVLDIDDTPASLLLDGDLLDAFSRQEGHGRLQKRGGLLQTNEQGNRLCMDVQILAFIMSVFFVTTVASIITLTIQCMRPRRVPIIKT